MKFRFSFGFASLKLNPEFGVGRIHGVMFHSLLLGG